MSRFYDFNVSFILTHFPVQFVCFPVQPGSDHLQSPSHGIVLCERHPAAHSVSTGPSTCVPRGRGALPGPPEAFNTAQASPPPTPQSLPPLRTHSQLPFFQQSPLRQQRSQELAGGSSASCPGTKTMSSLQSACHRIPLFSGLLEHSFINHPLSFQFVLY